MPPAPIEERTLESHRELVRVLDRIERKLPHQSKLR